MIHFSRKFYCFDHNCEKVEDINRDWGSVPVVNGMYVLYGR